jgi:hypothetical protein
MHINEVLGGLQGLGNLGGEMSRVTTPKKIKEIKPGKKNKSIKTRKGPMNIDLAKLGEKKKPNHLLAKSKVTKKVKPSTGHESPNVNRGKFVGEDDGMYDNPPQASRNARANQAASRQATRSNEFNWKEFYEWVFTNYSSKPGAQIIQQKDALMMKYQNAINKAKAEKQLNAPKQNYKQYDNAPDSAQGQKERNPVYQRAQAAAQPVKK